MAMNKKILAFVCDGKKFLALRNSSKDPSHGGDFWFVVTGSLEKDENDEEAVEREVLEETNLKVKEIFDLNWSSIYSWNKENHQEKNFIAFVGKGNLKLNEEHAGYLWLDLDAFIKKIKWRLDLKELKQALEKGIKKELFFKMPKTDDFRIK